MTTGNTNLSLPVPRPKTCFLSATPAGLQRLAEYGEYQPFLRVTIDELEQIVEGKQSEDMESTFADGFYLEDVLPAISWWIQIANSLLYGRSMDGMFFEPGFEEQKVKLQVLLSEVLSSYPAALAEGPFYSNSPSRRAPAAMELLKRYRLYTRYVWAFGREMWPEDLGCLLDPA